MSETVHFGPFDFDTERRELHKHGLRIRVPDQSLKILAALVARPGEVVTDERIRGDLWPNGTVVGFDQSIKSAVRRLREALGDPAGRALYIERAPHQGYRFTAPLQRLAVTEPGSARDHRSGAMVLHYRLIEKAGAGSMGDVWRAEDTKLGRSVALKFIPRRLASDAGALESLRQEAQQAAAVNHPNICTIHGLEESEDERFLVMEYIGGAPLRAVLDAAPLPARRIVELGKQIAAALCAAHAGGVIHRDVKPANLMLSEDGRVKLTDFGIALAARRGQSPPASATHTPAGTLGYMSPEQARGGAVDARSDLFSLGAVLYEMATGRRPFRGDTPEAVLRAVAHLAPERPRSLNPALPRDIERVILKALEKDPQVRWQSAAEMAQAMERIRERRTWPRTTVAGLVGVAAVVMVLWLSRRPQQRLALRDSIVIADFENRTTEPVFDGALRQALLSQMGQSPYLDIVSENHVDSVLQTMNRNRGERLTRDVGRDVCQRAGGKAVLVGTIGSLGNRYFVGLDAIACASGRLLASEYADAESKGRVLTALSQAASRIRGRLGESLASVTRLSALAEATTPSLEALKIYSLALRERTAGRDALPLIEHAIQVDPSFASAHFTLARIYQGRGLDAEAARAIARAYTLGMRTTERERVAIEGLYHSLVSGDADRGIAVGNLGLQLYPRDPAVWRWLVPAYMRTGEYEQALEVARRQLEVLPEDGSSYFDVALLLITLGRTAEARVVLDQATGRGAASEAIPLARFLIAALAGDVTAIEGLASSNAGKPWEGLTVIAQAQTAGYFGQLAKARGFERDAVERRLLAAPAVMANVALMEAVFGLNGPALSRAETAFKLDSGRRTSESCALASALAGSPDTAEAMLAGLLHRFPDDTMLNRIWVPSIRGAIKLARGDARAAIAVAKSPPNSARSAWPAYVRGNAYLRLGFAVEAAAEFRRIIAWRPALFGTAVGSGSAFGYPLAERNSVWPVR